MKTTLYDWRKHTVEGFRRVLDGEIAKRDQAQRNIDELLAVSRALAEVKLKRTNSGGEDREPAAKPKSKHVPWQHRPENKTKAAKWKKKMAAVNKKRWKR